MDHHAMWATRAFVAWKFIATIMTKPVTSGTLFLDFDRRWLHVEEPFTGAVDVHAGPARRIRSDRN
ncbi:hypothetical protein FBY31_2958 [Arthrobacter sp. SLBN-100]|nr:hypothetical protein FBY31_2958 [Arthrobacter sp. SLBN-100]